MDFANTIIPYMTLDSYKLEIKPLNFDKKLIKNNNVNLFEDLSIINYEFEVSVEAINEDDVEQVTNSAKSIDYVLIFKSNSSIFRESYSLEKNDKKYIKTFNIKKDDFRGSIEIQSLLLRKTSIKNSKNLMATDKGAVLAHSDIYNIFIDQPDFKNKGNTPTEWRSFSEDDFLKNDFKDNWYHCDFKDKKPIVYLNSDIAETDKDIIKSTSFGSSRKSKLRDAYHHQVANVFLTKLLFNSIYAIKETTKDGDSVQFDEIQTWQKEVLDLFIPIMMEIKDSETSKALFEEKIIKDEISDLEKRVDVAVSKHLKTYSKMKNLPDLLNRENKVESIDNE